jgi:pSer/pThr/pTyr-binding forkhead associated (FHA) protein
VTVDPTTPAPAPIAPNRTRRSRRDAAQRLVVMLPKERKGAAFTIAAEITIGRAPHCTVSVPDDTFVSQLHARLFRNADRTWIEDLGSTNGSYLNGQRLDSIKPFDKGDRLQIGSTVWEGQ